MKQAKNNFFHPSDDKIKVFYEGKQYDCIKIHHNLAHGDTDYAGMKLGLPTTQRKI